MTGDLIKSFLIGLGFDVDDASLAKFNKSIAMATLKVTALYTSIRLTAAGIGFGIKKIADGFEQLGYSFHIISPAINKALLLRRELLHAYSAAGVNIAKSAYEALQLNISLTKTKYVLEAIYKSVGAKFFTLLTKQSDLFRQKLYANMPRIQRALESFVQFVFKMLAATTALGERVWSILTRVYDFFVRLDQATHGWSTAILGILAAWKLLNLEFLATPLGLLITGFVALLALWDDFKTYKEGGISLIDWGSDSVKAITGVAAVAAGLVGTFYAISFATKAWTAATVVLNGLLTILNTILGITAFAATALELPFWAVAAAIGAVIAGVVYLASHLGLFSGIGDKIQNWLGRGTIDSSTGAPSGAGSFGPLNQDQLNSQNGTGKDSGFWGQLKALLNNPNAQANFSNFQPQAGGASASPLGANNSKNSTVNMKIHQETNIVPSSGADVNSLGRAADSSQKNNNRDVVRYAGKGVQAK